MKRSWWSAGVLLAGCATTELPPVSHSVAIPGAPARVEPSEVERACLEAISRAGERLATDEFAACTRDSDCRPISPLLSGHCGTVANARVFDAHLEDFQAQTAICDPAVQLVPKCIQLQSVCRQERCTGEPISELPDECAELRAAFEKDADKANTCQLDSDCSVFGTDRPATEAFLSSSLDRQEQLARACGTVLPSLFVVRPVPTEVFCVAGRCVTEKASPHFTTVVQSRRAITPPVLDHACITEKFISAFTNLRRRREWLVQFVSNLDVTGRQNQFEFIHPADLSVDAQSALASRLSECRSKPALFRGKPIAIREVFRIRWISE